MRTRLIIILLLLCAGAAAVPGRAAGQDPDSARAVLRRNVLCQGAQVMISTTFAERFRGRCVLQDERLLVVDPRGVETPILYTAVDSIWVRGPGTRAGTVTGAWIGGALGAAFGMLFVAGFCEVDCRGDYVTHGVAGAAAGGFSGGVAGGLIGREARVWIRQYPG